jgi:hypothetical protein
MEIVVKRTGGYAGTEEVQRVDTSRLESARQKEVEEWARRAMQNAPTAEPVGADLMRYEITVQDGPTKRSITWVDDGTRSGTIGRLIEGLADLKTQPSQQPR